MSLVRVHNFSISLDGFGTGEGQTLDAPFGHAGERLHEWMFATRWWHESVGQARRHRGIDDAFAAAARPGIGAEIMGAEQVRPSRMARRPGVEGLVGRQPAVPHTDLRPHPPSAPVDRDGGRHDLPLPRRLAGRGARDGPRGRRRPGRPHRRRRHHVRDFLAAGLVDHMHVVVVPPPRRTSWPSAALPGGFERLGGRGVDEVERRAALHLDRRARMVGEDERRCVERRVVAPPPSPLRVVLPARRTELARTHDLGTDSRVAAAAMRRRCPRCRPARRGLGRPPRGEHPLVEPLPGVAERRLEGLPLAGGEPFERDEKLWMRTSDMAAFYWPYVTAAAGSGRWR